MIRRVKWASKFSIESFIDALESLLPILVIFESIVLFFNPEACNDGNDDVYSYSPIRTVYMFEIVFFACNLSCTYVFLILS